MYCPIISPTKTTTKPGVRSRPAKKRRVQEDEGLQPLDSAPSNVFYSSTDPNINIGMDSDVPHSLSFTPSLMTEQIEANIGDGYPEFVDSVLNGGAAFYQIGADTFVVNGWDMKGKCSKVVRTQCNNPDSTSQICSQETWYHAQHKTIGSENIFVCLCPTSRLDTNCVHKQFLKECGAEFFPSDDVFGGTPYYQNQITREADRS
ncbi:hypothetical protein C8J57DRAFT_1244455 [Mycena rebaudengoi]|nr:hypothetical protein C8J57DRAFT_1244455 [Mycena rebaudengoi]